MRTLKWLVIAAIAGGILWIGLHEESRQRIFSHLSSVMPLTDGLGDLKKKLAPRQQWREPEILTDERYREWGIPNPGQGWGLVEMKKFSRALASRNSPVERGAMPSSRTDFGVGIFREILAVVSRFEGASIEDQIDLYNAHLTITETYAKRSEDGWRYDREMAVLWSAHVELSEILYQHAKEERVRLRELVWSDETDGRKRTQPALKVQSSSLGQNFRYALEASRDDDYFQPGARLLFATRLETVFQKLKPFRKRQFHGQLMTLSRQETDAAIGEIYHSMMVQSE